MMESGDDGLFVAMFFTAAFALTVLALYTIRR